MPFVSTDILTLYDSVTSICLHPDGRLAIAAGTGVTLWDPDTKESQTLEHNDLVTCVAVHPNGNVLTGSYTYMYVWGDSEPKITEYNDRVTCIAVHSDGLILSGSGTSVKGLTLTLQHDDPVTSIAVIQDGRVVTAAGLSVKIWDTNLTDGETKEYEDDVSIVEAFADGRVLVGCDNNVHVWDPDYGYDKTFEHNNRITSLAVISEKLFVSGLEDGTIKIWNIEEEIEYEEFNVDEGSWASALVALPDGSIVSGSGAGTVQMWDANTLEPVVKLGEKSFRPGTRLFTLITSKTFDRSRDLAFFGKHLGLNVRATLHNTSNAPNLWLHVFNTTEPLRLLTAPRQWRQSIYGDSYIGLQELEKHLIKYCIRNNFDGWHMRVKIDNRVSDVTDAEYETVVLKSSFHKLAFRGKKKVTLQEIKDKDHVRVTNGKIVFVKRIERLEELFGNLRF